MNNGGNVIPWKSVSPDLNAMENICSLLVRTVYSNGKKYTSISKLKAAITYHRKEIN